MIRTAAVVLLLYVVPNVAAQQPAADFFRSNCTSCHTVGGGRLVGPDLKNVGQRRDRAWLVRFLQNPKGMIDSGDAYALKLQQEARGVVMPTLPGMNPSQADALLNLLDAESKLARSQFAGSQISMRPFTAQDVANGRTLFEGNRPLANGAPACVSCHTLKGVGGLGGGRLGPDLTLVFERLQGRKGLSAWLTSPVSPTMQPVFRTRTLQPEEILALTALFEDSARKGGVSDNTTMLDFFLLGLGGMVLGLVGIDAVWKKRLRGVRKPLVLSPYGKFGKARNGRGER